MIYFAIFQVEFNIVSVEKIRDHNLHNITITVMGPSRTVLLLSPSKQNVIFEMWGFNHDHLHPLDERLANEENSHYMLQFIQGLHPRLIVYSI